MRPALVPSSFDPQIGGVETVAKQLALGLQSRGHDPIVFTNKWPKSLPNAETLNGIPVRRSVFRVPEPNIRQLGGWALTSNGTKRRMVRDSREASVDLVNLHCVSSNSRYALTLAKQLRIPLVLSLHGELTGDATDVFARSSQLRRSWQQLMTKASVITAPSEQTLELAEIAFGRSVEGRGLVIPNGVDLDLFGSPSSDPPGPPAIVVVGRLVAMKNVDLVIRAYADVQASIPHKLIIVGDGPERLSLEAQVAAADLDSRVTFTGALPPEKVAAVMKTSQILILASRQEALGLVLLEAMATGTAVIATRVGGIPSIVQDGQNGILFSPDNFPELVAAMSQLASDEALRLRCVGGGKATAANFGWSRCVDLYISAFESAMA